MVQAFCRSNKRERGAHGTVLAPPREVSPYSYDRRPPAFSPPSLRVWAARSPLQKRARALAGLRLHCAAMPSRCAGLGKPCPKGCGGCNFASTRSATHSCTPEFAHSDRSELTGSYAIGTNKVLREARGGPEDELLFNATEIEEGYVCDHFRAAALKGAAAPKRSPGRPRKTPSPQRNGENGLARCAICSGPHRKHLLQQGRRVGLADQTLSAAACDAAQVAHGTYACERVAPCPWPLSRHLTREGAVQAPELAY